MSIIRDFTLYLNAGISTPEVVHVNQYDQGEVWRFTLLESDGSQYTPSSGALIGVKADGHAIAGVTGTVLGDGRVSITETQQMTAAAGDAIFELTIDGGSHGSANFIVRVEKKPTDDAILSESDLSIIQEGMNSVTPVVIAETVSDWLEDNLTDPPIDPTLSISNAAADASVTGDKITELNTTITAINGVEINIIDGEYVRHSNGAFVTQEAYSYLDYYPVIPSGKIHVETYFGYQAGIVFYDESKQFVKGVNNPDNTENILFTDDIDVPANAVYVIVSCVKIHKSELVIQNSIVPPVAETRREVLSAFSTQTAGGSVATFADGAHDVPVVNADILLSPIMAGSGTPSKVNVRNISGRTSAGIYVGSEYDAEEANQFSFTWNDTVYSGVVDTQTGIITVTGILFTPTAVSAMGALSDGKYRARFATPQPIKVASTSEPNAGVYCNMYETISANGTYLKRTGISDGGNNTTVWIYDPDLQTAEEWSTFLNNNNLQIVIPLATPQKINITPKTIKTFLGTNYIWSLNGDVSIVYRADPTLYLQQALIVKNPCDYKGEEISVFNKILCVGDSLTEGIFNYKENGSIYNYVSENKYSYPTILHKITGVDVTNKGRSGASSAEWYAAEADTDLSGYDIAIIQLGVNDEIRYGTWGATSETAFTNIISKLKAENKNIKIFVANIIPALSYSQDSMLAFSNALLSWVQTTYASDTSVIPVDIQKYGHTKEETAYNAGHLSAYGYWRLACDYKAFIGWYMHENPDLFREIQFIGTDYVFE